MIFFILFWITLFSRLVMLDPLQPHRPQHSRPSCPPLSPRAHPNPCPLCQWHYLDISSPLPSIFLSIRVFFNKSSLLIWWQNIRASVLLSDFPKKKSGLVTWLRDWVIWSPCSPRVSQESSPTPLKSTNSLSLSLSYGQYIVWDNQKTYWRKFSILIYNSNPGETVNSIHIG